MTLPDDAEPSAEALELLKQLRAFTHCRTGWVAFIQSAPDAALALDRFRAAGVREERERTRAAINAVRDSNIIKGRSYSACWMNACTEIESALSTLPEPPK